MNLPKGHPPHMHDAVAAAYGVKTARAVAAEHGLTTKAVRSIWTRHLAAGRLTKPQRPDRDGPVVQALKIAGRAGLSSAEIADILGEHGDHRSASRFAHRARSKGVAIDTVRVKAASYRYRCAEPRVTDQSAVVRSPLCAALGIVPVARRAPDGFVSVPRVTMIDGARAAGGESLP